MYFVGENMHTVLSVLAQVMMTRVGEELCDPCMLEYFMPETLGELPLYIHTNLSSIIELGGFSSSSTRQRSSHLVSSAHLLSSL